MQSQIDQVAQARAAEAAAERRQFERMKLKHVARIRFFGNSARRAARRRRWAEEEMRSELTAEFLAGASILSLSKKHGIKMPRVQNLISSATPEEVNERNRMMRNSRNQRNRLRMECSLDRVKPDRKRYSKSPVNGFPSLTDAAKAEGVSVKTLWMRLHRAKTKPAMGRPGQGVLVGEEWFPSIRKAADAVGVSPTTARRMLKII